MISTQSASRSRGFSRKEITRIRELIVEHHEELLETCMRSSAAEKLDAVAADVMVSDDALSVGLSDGRKIVVPLEWYPRLLHAATAERKSWRFIGRGRGIHWPAIDEDISVANLLLGQQSSESQTSFKRWLAARSKRRRRRSKGPK